MENTKKHQAIYHFIIDESGSMQDSVKDIKEGLAAQLNEIAKLSQENPEMDIRVGYTTFNDTYKHHLMNASQKNTALLSDIKYQPNGTTALLDAMGFTMEKLELIQQEEEHIMPTTVVCIIMTDGHENASRFYTHLHIKEKIAKLRATDKWTILFVGADIDTTTMKRDMGIYESEAMQIRKYRQKQQLWDNVKSYMKLDIEYKKTHNTANKNFKKDENKSN
jgi:Mg-chelatase subunit ChlD